MTKTAESAIKHERKLTVFVSYSRSDIRFAEELDAGLRYDGGFKVLIDRYEIEEGEDWRGRLGKRILPLYAETRLGKATPPPQLSALNYVLFERGADGRPRSFIEGLTALRNALNTNVDWLREHTRLLNRAEEWDAAGRPANRLLTGPDIEAAKRWLEGKPQNAPSPTELHRDVIQASALAEDERQSLERRR